MHIQVENLEQSDQSHVEITDEPNTPANDDNSPTNEESINELISVIIPVASWDKTWENILADLSQLPNGTEIIFSVSEKDQSFEELPDMVDNLQDKRVKWIRSPSGRAQCLNTGAQAATSKYLWFLHADSRFAQDAYTSLADSVKENTHAVHYFNLRFLSDGPPAMILNEIGAKIRSKFFGSPFGDQGLCISREAFEKLGGFPEDAEYGEDHLLVWYAKQHGMDLICTNATLMTSARKYQKQGWLNLTLRHQKLWIQQAWPEFMILMKWGKRA